MKKIQIDETHCPQNHVCPVISRCPMGAISQESPNKAPQIDAEKCTACGVCTRFCNTFQKV